MVEEDGGVTVDARQFRRRASRNAGHKMDDQCPLKRLGKAATTAMLFHVTYQASIGLSMPAPKLFLSVCDVAERLVTSGVGAGIVGGFEGRVYDGGV